LPSAELALQILELRAHRRYFLDSELRLGAYG
jgi:hypothetical protein